MKRSALILICSILVIHIAKGQDKIDTSKFYSKDFNWSIIIPANFTRVSQQEWSGMQNRGSQAIEKTYNQKIVNQSKTIFVFKSDRFNYFEANYQPFDAKKDGSYLAMDKSVDRVLFHTMETQMPKAKVDSISTVTKIGNLDFQTFIIRVDFQNDIVLSMYEFTRVFDKREFCVNIIFLNSTKGDLMLNAWKSSTFGN